MTAVAPRPIPARATLLQGGAPPLILASASKIRRTVLEHAGLAFTVEAAAVD
jgi:hypothetical protein